jgi:hypothetical protein
MASNRVGDMTIEELKKLVDELIDQRLRFWPRPQSARTLDEIRASIKRNRLTPPPGAKSTLELLREDRDR